MSCEKLLKRYGSSAELAHHNATGAVGQRHGVAQAGAFRDAAGQAAETLATAIGVAREQGERARIVLTHALEAAEQAKADEEAKAKGEEEAKDDEDAKSEDDDEDDDDKAKGPKPVLVKGTWTCPNKWTYVKGACVKS